MRLRSHRPRPKPPLFFRVNKTGVVIPAVSQTVLFAGKQLLCAGKLSDFAIRLSDGASALAHCYACLGCMLPYHTPELAATNREHQPVAYVFGPLLHRCGGGQFAEQSSDVNTITAPVLTADAGVTRLGRKCLGFSNKEIKCPERSGEAVQRAWVQGEGQGVMLKMARLVTGKILGYAAHRNRQVYSQGPTE